MKRILNLLALSALVLAGASCNKSNADQMTMAENVIVTCTPAVLEVVAGNIPVQMSVSYPKGYFHPKASMVVTPVLVYEGGQLTGDSFVYQGEDIKDNYKVVSTKGGTVKESFSFPYVVGCEKSHLELRSVVFFDGKRVEVPARKVADGCNTTYKLADMGGAISWRADGYQEVIRQSTEGQILYDVNSADVKGSQLNSESIRDLKAALAEFADNDRITVTGTRVVAYASPEGGEKLNSELSDKRASSAQKAWDKISKGMDANSTEVVSVGQDWEGFQEAVSKSNILDKDLILRVLSMYSDPAVRESEIRNMSQIYTEISDKVFPELRRARFITETEYKNYTDEELEQVAKRRLYLLDEPSVLHVATNTDDVNRKILLYKLAISQFNSDIARFNLAKLYFDMNQVSLAESYLDQMNVKGEDVTNAKGLAALRSGHMEQAKELFTKAGSDEARQNLGLIDILEGNYAAAAEKYKGVEGNNAALAQILAGDLAAAEKALTGDDAKADYLRAVIAARKGLNSEASKYLKSAASKDEALKARAEKDIEFAAFAN